MPCPLPPKDDAPPASFVCDRCRTSLGMTTGVHLLLHGAKPAIAAKTQIKCHVCKRRNTWRPAKREG